MIPWNPGAVVIGPGGTRAYYYLGALRALAEAGVLADVQTWIGVSAGAMSVTGCPRDSEIRYPSPVDPVFG